MPTHKVEFVPADPEAVRLDPEAVALQQTACGHFTGVAEGPAGIRAAGEGRTPEGQGRHGASVRRAMAAARTVRLQPVAQCHSLHDDPKMVGVKIVYSES